MPCKKRVERANGDQFEAHHMCFAQRQLFEHFVSDGRIGDVDDERHARFPCSEYHCAILPSRQRSTVSRTSSGRTANTCDCSKPGLMVPMARILVVGVVFIAAPCAFAEWKPTRQPITANAAAETIFMLLPSVCRSDDRVNPQHMRPAPGGPFAVHHKLAAYMGLSMGEDKKSENIECFQ